MGGQRYVRASAHSPVALKIGDDVGRGVVSRVHTGSKMPDQADSVVMVEDVERLDDVAEIRVQVHPFENVGLKGYDYEARTHSAVASAVKLGKADAGKGIKPLAD